MAHNNNKASQLPDSGATLNYRVGMHASSKSQGNSQFTKKKKKKEI